MTSWLAMMLLALAPSASFAEDCPPATPEIALPKGLAEVDTAVQAVPLQATGSAPCSKAGRDSLDSPASCCTPGMLGEIQNLTKAALPKIEAAIAALSNSSTKESLLWKHFRVKPNDTARLNVIRARMTEIALSLRDANSVNYYCRDAQDDACAGGKRRAATENCTSLRPPRMWLCGSYVGSNFLPGSSWLKTLIHEHAHAGCRAIGDMSSAGTETYSHNSEIYPPATDKAIRNADSYASFVLEF